MSCYTHWQVTAFILNKDSLTVKYEDLKADNLLLGFETSSVIDHYVRQLGERPPLHKEVNGHQSAANFGRLRKGVGMIKISDFGAAVFCKESTLHFHDIQPSPEVLLKAGWTYSADVWNLGMMVRCFSLCD